MNKTLALSFLFMIALLTGCSHNPAILTVGRQIRLGTAEYGDLTYLNGFAIIDCARENSEWEIEIDENDGISFDVSSKTLKGVKRIRRRIGKQVTGYLKDISKNNPDAVWEYLKGDVMVFALPAETTKKKDDNASVKPKLEENGAANK